MRSFLWGLWVAMTAGGLWYSFLTGQAAAAVWRSTPVDHGVAFAALSLVGVTASQRRAWRVVAVMLAIGLLIELVQTRIPGRAFEWIDLAEDATGIAVGWALVRLSQRTLQMAETQ